MDNNDNHQLTDNVTEEIANTVADSTQTDEILSSIADPLSDSGKVEEVADSGKSPEENLPEKGDAKVVISDDVPSEESESDAESPEEGQNGDDTDIQQDFPLRKYEDSYYLLYGKEKVADCLDLQGTKEFLDSLGFRGGELLQARREKQKAHEFEKKGENESELVCSYCNLSISGVDYYRLRDGRCRCTQCSRSLVKSVEQLQDIFKRIIKDMEILFDAVITTDIEIELTDEITIKKKCKLSIGDIDNKNIMIFGVAIRDKDGYRICIENSLPRIRVISVFVHELTHIWQYENWDKGQRPKEKKCIFKRKPKHGQLGSTRELSDYEGMAKWAQIQYLYLIGETKVAEQEEMITRKRKDEYGFGFMKYDQMYPLQKKVMTKNKTPFSGYAASKKGDN